MLEVRSPYEPRIEILNPHSYSRTPGIVLDWPPDNAFAGLLPLAADSPVLEHVGSGVGAMLTGSTPAAEMQAELLGLHSDPEERVFTVAAWGIQTHLYCSRRRTPKMDRQVPQGIQSEWIGCASIMNLNGQIQSFLMLLDPDYWGQKIGQRVAYATNAFACRALGTEVYTFVAQANAASHALSRSLNSQNLGEIDNRYFGRCTIYRRTAERLNEAPARNLGKYVLREGPGGEETVL